MSDKRKVTEWDLRMPEFKDHRVKLKDLEFRDDGKIVRKDRWESAVRQCMVKLGCSGRNSEFEVEHLVVAVDYLLSKVPACPDYIEQRRIEAREEAAEQALADNNFGSFGLTESGDDDFEWDEC